MVETEVAQPLVPLSPVAMEKENRKMMKEKERVVAQESNVKRTKKNGRPKPLKVQAISNASGRQHSQNKSKNSEGANAEQGPTPVEGVDANGNVKVYYPVVFSRKETFTNPVNPNKEEEPSTPSAVTSLIHQSDRHGVPTPTHFKAAVHNEWSDRQTSSQNVYNASSDAMVKKTTHERDTNSGDAGYAVKTKRLSQLFKKCIFVFSNQQTEEKQASQMIPSVPSLLGPQHRDMLGKKCLVLDLDETLVHSSFKPIPNPDYIVSVEIENVVHKIYVTKRPGVHEFLSRVGKHYEVVIFTASLKKYADPLMDMMDTEGISRYRLFREHCVCHEGNYVKDLSMLTRELSQTIIVDNSPASYLFHPENAIPCTSFIDDMGDNELYYLADFLDNIAHVDDVRNHLPAWNDYVY